MIESPWVYRSSVPGDYQAVAAGLGRRGQEPDRTTPLARPSRLRLRVKAAPREEKPGWVGTRGQCCKVSDCMRFALITSQSSTMSCERPKPKSSTHESPTKSRANPDQPGISEDDEHVEALATSSTTSTGSIQPTWPKPVDVDLVKAKAVAIWQDDIRLPDVLFDLHWHPKSYNAFFKLRGQVTDTTDDGRNVKLNIYLYIYPERIRQLSVDADSPDKMLLGAETRVLRFEMARPPALIIPKPTYIPKNEASKTVLDAFRRLAGQTRFAIYARIPRKKLAIKRMRELCTAAADCRLSSLTTRSSIANLYHGKGGHVIEGVSLTEAFSEPPPEYAELSQPAYMSPRQINDRKCFNSRCRV